MRFSLLGQLRVVDDRGESVALGGLKQRAVLGALLTHANQVVAKSRLAEWLWPGDQPPSAAHSIEVYVSRLRRLIGSDGPGRLLASDGGYRLRVEVDELDTGVLDVLVGRAKDQEARGDLAGALESLTEALRLFRGPIFGDLESFGFATLEVARLESLRLSLVEHQAELELGCGTGLDLPGRLEGYVTAHPERERLWELLMLAYCRDGNQSAALSAYARARSHLREELGIDPGLSLAGLQLRVLRQDPSLPWPPPPAPVSLESKPNEPLSRRRIGRLVTAMLSAFVLVVLPWTMSAPTPSGEAVLLVDVTSGAVIARLPGSHALQIVHTDGLFWILRGNSQNQAVSLVAIDERSGAVLKELASPYTDVGYMLARPDGIWITDYQNPELAHIDPISGLITDRIALDEGSSPQFRGTSTGGEQVVLADANLWVGRTGEVVQVDPTQGRVVRRFPMPYEWGMMAAGDRVWICRQDGVTWIDVHTGKQGPVAPITRPQNLVSVGGGVWAADPYGNVYEVSPTGQTHLLSTRVGPQTAVELARNTSTVWRANGTGSVVAIDLGSSHERQYGFDGAVQTLAAGERTVLIGVATRTQGENAPLADSNQPTGRVLRMAWTRSTADPSDPALLDSASNPWYAQLSRLTCSQLVRAEQGATGPILAPDLAVDLPRVSADGLAYRFTINAGIRFAPPVSRALTAQDVAFSIERALAAEPRKMSPAATLLKAVRGSVAFMEGRSRHVTGIEAEGNVVTITLNRRQPDLLWRLSTPTFCVVPEGSPSPSGLLPPPSAGPYYLTAHENGGITVLARNPNYSRSAPINADTIIIDESHSVAAAVATTNDGGLQHLAYDDPSFAPPGAIAAVRGGDRAYYASRRLAVHYLAFNSRRPPFNDRRARQAVAAALNRAELATAQGDVASRSLLPDGVFATPASLALPTKRAVPLVGRTLRLGIQLGCHACAAVAELVVEQLRALGMSVRVRPVAEMSGKTLAHSDLHLALVETRLAYPAPATFLATMLGHDIPAEWLTPDVATAATRLSVAPIKTSGRTAMRLANQWDREAVVVVYGTGTMGEVLSGLTCAQGYGIGFGIDLSKCTLE